MRGWHHEEEGAVFVEYGYLITFIVIAVAIAGTALALALAGIFTETGETVDGAEFPTLPARGAEEMVGEITGSVDGG